MQVEMSLKWYWRLQLVCCQESGVHPNIARIALHWQLFKKLTLDLLGMSKARSLEFVIEPERYLFMQ